MQSETATDDSCPVDLTNCDREPIHILGAIQPIGFLLALTADWMIARASANTIDFLGLAPADLFGKPLQQVFSARAVHDLRNRAAMLRVSVRSGEDRNGRRVRIHRRRPGPDRS